MLSIRLPSFSHCPITPPRSSLISRARTPIRPGQSLHLGKAFDLGNRFFLCPVRPQSCQVQVTDSACRPILMDGVLVLVHRYTHPTLWTRWCSLPQPALQGQIGFVFSLPLAYSYVSSCSAALLGMSAKCRCPSVLLP